MRIYVAAALAAYARAQQIADHLQSTDHKVVSNWHRKATVRASATDPQSDAERQAQLWPNISDIEIAEAMVVLADQGNPRATFVEAGYALGRGLPVVWVVGQAGEGRCLFDSHPAVVRLTTSVFDTKLSERVLGALRVISEAA